MAKWMAGYNVFASYVVIFTSPALMKGAGELCYGGSSDMPTKVEESRLVGSHFATPKFLYVNTLMCRLFLFRSSTRLKLGLALQ